MVVSARNESDRIVYLGNDSIHSLFIKRPESGGGQAFPHNQTGSHDKYLLKILPLTLLLSYLRTLEYAFHPFNSNI